MNKKKRMCENIRVTPTPWVRYGNVNPLMISIGQKYYTIIDFNEVDMRIYLPEKVIIHQGR